MKDSKKRVVIDLPEKEHAELKIRLRYDDMTQTGFFRAIAEGYVKRDELLVEYIESYKQEKGIQSKYKQKKITDSNKERAETIRKFALDDNEISDIYDLVEKEFPDL